MARAATLRAALDWAFSRDGDAQIGIALTAAAVPLWMQLSLVEECRRRVERALDCFTEGFDTVDLKAAKSLVDAPQ